MVIKEFNKRMLDLMLEFRVWAECRPIHERDTHGEQLVKEMEEIEAREVFQGNYTETSGSFTTRASSIFTQQNRPVRISSTSCRQSDPHSLLLPVADIFLTLAIVSQLNQKLLDSKHFGDYWTVGSCRE